MKPISNVAALSAILPTRSFSDEVMNRYRQQTDPLADAVIDAVAAGGHAGMGNLMRWLGQPTNRSLDEQPEVLQRFFAENAVLPPFADWTKMQRGMVYFKKREGAIALMLGFLSLPYTYLGADGTQVLMISGRMQKDTWKRLEETGEFLFGLMNEPAWKTNDAFFRCLKVRMIHAAVRWYTRGSGRWNEVWGPPVNQEDMAETNLSFSWVVIRGLRQTGLAPTDAEAESYLHLWNVIGALNGVTPELLPQNLREAYTLDKTIVRRHFRPSPEGQALTKALLRAIEEFIPDLSLKGLPAAQMRFLLGDEYANWLAIPDVPVEKRLVRLVPMQLFAGIAPAPLRRGEGSQPGSFLSPLSEGERGRG